MRIPGSVVRRFNAVGFSRTIAVGKRFAQKRKFQRVNLYNAGNTPRRAVYATAVKRIPKIKAFFGGREVIARRVLAEVAKNPSISVLDLSVMLSRELNSEGFKVFATKKTAQEKSGMGLVITPGLVASTVRVLTKEKLIKDFNPKNPKKKK